MADNERPYSSLVVDGVEQAPSRAMLYPVGFSEEDFSKPQIGIASTWSMVTPCNMHINELADEALKGADAAGAGASGRPQPYGSDNDCAHPRNPIEMINAIILSGVRKKVVTCPIDRDEYDELLNELRSGKTRIERG